MKNFKGFGLHDTLLHSLDRMGYDTPTPIQASAIPIAMDGRDIMGSAQTGTGKTAAFAIPVVEKLLNTPEGGALILTPTRELGKQIMDIFHQLLGPKSPLKTAFLIGGESIGKQINQLKQKPRIIVGTPGRINDHLKRRTLNLSKTDFLVLDETDRMLDMGFAVQLDSIFEYMPQQRQTLMFSATLPKNILKMSERYLTNPERVAVGSTFNPAENIHQDIIRLDNDSKYTELVTQLKEREGSIIIFVKTKYGAEKLAKRLRGKSFSADAMHGDLRQNRRTRLIQEYRNQKFRILVATDVASRGLDIPHIEHVINYDLPQVPEDYIHRIGRTARAGAKGNALCLITPQDGRKWNAIEQLMYPNKKKAEPEGKSGKKRGNKKYIHKKGEGKGKPYSKAKKSHRGQGGAAQGGKYTPRGARPNADSAEHQGRPDNRKKSGTYAGAKTRSDRNDRNDRNERGDSRKSFKSGPKKPGHNSVKRRKTNAHGGKPQGGKSFGGKAYAGKSHAGKPQG